jgi:hypothetical protein
LGLQTVATLFDRRMRGLAELGPEHDDIAAWKRFILFGIPKKFVPQADLDKWRGIALCSSLLKWYEMALWIVLDRCIRPLPDWIVGFRPGRQVLDIAAGIATALGKAQEWNRPLVVVSVDVRAAFDNVTVELLGEVLADRGAPPVLVFAAIRELANLTAVPLLAAAEAQPVPFAGGPQGRPRVPSAWSHILAWILEPEVRAWQADAEEGRPSIFWCPEWQAFSLQVWADNLFLVADSVQLAASRARAVEARLAAFGIGLGSDSLEILVNEAARSHRLGAELQLRAGRLVEVEQLRVLGVLLDRTGSTPTQIRHRLRVAVAIWQRWKHVLCSRAPFAKRLAKLDQAVGGSALFGAGAWALSAATATTLRIASNRWARLMLGRKPPEQDWLAWIRACNSFTQ